MHVLVTGATGFVGGRLVPARRVAGHGVRVPGRDPDPPAGVADGDLRDPVAVGGICR